MSEIILIIFTALSIGVLILLIVSAIGNFVIKEKQLFVMLSILVITLAIAGYMFDYEANSNNDLSRFVQEFEAIKRNRGDLFKILNKNHPFEYLYVVIAYVESFMTNYHWFPVVCVLFEYSVYLYILMNESKNFDNQALGILVCIIFKISLIPPYMSIAASRNIIAYALFSLGVYRLLRSDKFEGKKDFISFLMVIGGGLIHTSVFFSVIVLVLSILIYKRQKLLPLFLLWGLLYTAILELLSNFTGEVADYLTRKGTNYLEEMNKTNAFRMGATLPWIIVFLVICFIYLYIGKKYSRRSVFVLAQTSVAIGAAFIPTLFLRMCYPVGIMFPIVYAELQTNREEKTFRGQQGLLIILLIASLIMFYTTRYGWIKELVLEITGVIR